MDRMDRTGWTGQDGWVPGSLPNRPSRPPDGISWYDAWFASSTGTRGFWRSERPSRHFRTAAGATGLLARMVLTLLADRPDISTVVDIGCGDGRLLAHLGALAPQLRLMGLDLRAGVPQERPGPAVEWIVGSWDVAESAWIPIAAGGPDSMPLPRVLPTGRPMAIICAEWLDDLPAVVAERGPTAWQEVLVRPDGRESLGGPVTAADARWLDHWWPAEGGQRAESGRTRDAAWSSVIDCLRPAGGLAVMIDYGHRRDARPPHGSLTGYQRGRQVRPRPSTDLNLTAHVAVDSVAAAGESAGARTQLLTRQREAVGRLLPDPPLLGESDTLTRLQYRGERRLLTDTLGDHWFLVQSVAPDGPAGGRATGWSAEGGGTNPRAELQ